MRFLNNIVRYSGCGVFSAPVSHVVVDRASREFVALVLGSRVSPQSGHITQLCVHPDLPPPRPGAHAARRGRLPLHAPGRHRDLPHRHRSQRRGHRSLPGRGLHCAHSFDAAVWQRDAGLKLIYEHAEREVAGLYVSSCLFQLNGLADKAEDSSGLPGRRNASGVPGATGFAAPALPLAASCSRRARACSWGHSIE